MSAPERLSAERRAELRVIAERWPGIERRVIGRLALLALLDQAAEAERLRAALERLRSWDMLAKGSWLADAPYMRRLIDAALTPPEPPAGGEG